MWVMQNISKPQSPVVHTSNELVILGGYVYTIQVEENYFLWWSNERYAANGNFSSFCAGRVTC